MAMNLDEKVYNIFDSAGADLRINKV